MERMKGEAMDGGRSVRCVWVKIGKSIFECFSVVACRSIVLAQMSESAEREALYNYLLFGELITEYAMELPISLADNYAHAIEIKTGHVFRLDKFYVD